MTLITRAHYSTLDDPHASHSPDTAKVWGTAYRIAASHVAEVRAYLDIREINGYTIHYTPFHPAENPNATISTLVYIGTPDNAQFMGPQDPQALAEHIYKSEGPSGPNKEYLLELETALEELSTESGDGHVRDLAERVTAIAAREEGVSERKTTEMANVHENARAASMDTLEETENDHWG